MGRGGIYADGFDHHSPLLFIFEKITLTLDTRQTIDTTSQALDSLSSLRFIDWTDWKQTVARRFRTRFADRAK